MVVGMFIPLTGRSGSFNNPDLTVGIICCAMTIYVTSYLVSPVSESHKLFLIN